MVLILFGPYLWASLQYMWVEHTTSGLVAFLVTGTIDALGSLLLGAITNPVKAILFLVAGAMCSRVAFGRR